MSIDAVIFDFNGVLVDDEFVHFALFREVLAQEGVVITERDYHERYLGYDDRGCFEAALRDAGHPADPLRLDRLVVRKAVRYVEFAERGLRFFPAAAQTLGTVASRWPVAICSGALRSEIEYALRKLGCLGQVAVIISAEDTAKCKPDPEGYRLALTALQSRYGSSQASATTTTTTTTTESNRISPAGCLVIEDSLAGIASAKAAGMQAIGVTNTYDAALLRQAGADLVIDELTTLTPEWIEQRFSRVNKHTN
jgi:beta-phosphoglucomutase-like phosphatase (HAD superfamily)